jgi:hypothetical protein
MSPEDVFFKQYGKADFEERREWYEEQKEEVNPPHFVPDGDAETARLAEEQKYAFCHGLDLSTVFLGAGAVEQVFHYLASQLLDNIDEGQKIGLGGLLGRLQDSEYSYLIEDLEDDVEELVEDRKTSYHYRSPFSPESPTMEKMPVDEDRLALPADMFEEEARHAVRTTMRVLGANWNRRLREEDEN